MHPLFGLIFFLLFAVTGVPVSAQTSYYDDYAVLLANYVSHGVVDYAGLKEHGGHVNRVLDVMASVDPQRLSDADRIAYYINVYNAWTLQLILEHWPGIRSIKEAGSLIRSPWKRKFVRLYTGTVSLDAIEHDILRRTFPDPRIHFALNCASRSCPALAAEPYQGRTLSEQLQARTAAFINNSANTFVRDGRLHVSRIFDWYGEDFGGRDGIWTFIRRSAGPTLAAAMDAVTDRRLVFTEYDWSLNDRPLPGRSSGAGDAAGQP
jgi:hypothetical protein